MIPRYPTIANKENHEGITQYESSSLKSWRLQRSIVAKFQGLNIVILLFSKKLIVLLMGYAQIVYVCYRTDRAGFYVYCYL